MSMPPDPLTQALRDAFEAEHRTDDDDALIARAIARATNRLSATSPAASVSAPAEAPRAEVIPLAPRSSARGRELSARSRSRRLRIVIPLAATFAASIALASVYLATRGGSEPPAAPPSEPPAAPKLEEPSQKTATTIQPGEIPSISVSDLPSAKPSAAVMSAPVWSPPPPDTPVTAAELFRDANAERRAGNVGKAVDLYGALQKRFPDSAETQAAHVSLGRLLLERDAKGALAQFDAYLNSKATDSTLSEEARLGRALAFQRLGQPSAERAAWEELLAKHPQSFHTARARERLRALEDEAH